MTRYETRFLDWPSHFISTASVPEVTENSQEELSESTIYLLHSVPASGNTLPSELNMRLEKYITFLPFHEKICQMPQMKIVIKVAQQSAPSNDKLINLPNDLANSSFV